MAKLGDNPKRAILPPVVIWGAGRRARAWTAAIERGGQLRVAGVIGLGDGGIEGRPSLPRFRTLDEALGALPSARIAAALPPRAALDAALALAERGQPSLVQAPLYAGRVVDPLRLPVGASHVQVAHGWCTLAGRTRVENLLRRAAYDRAVLDIHGLPEEPGGERIEVLAHALALVARMFGPPSIERLDADGAVDLRAGAIRIRLSCGTQGQRLGLTLAGPNAAPIEWTWRPHEETIVSDGQRWASPCPTGEERALRQLAAPDEAGGDDLSQAVRVLGSLYELTQRLPGLKLAGLRQLDSSARRLVRRPGELLTALGLRGVIPSTPPGSVAAPAPPLSAALPSEPLELWAFRAGLKPVVFLTLRPDQVPQAIAGFGNIHVERRERRVLVGPQDAWTDRRDRGEPRVEVFLSVDPSLARRAADLQARDPSAATEEMGELLGYPVCCVRAFAAQGDRSNNSANRYACASRTEPTGPWPWELNDLFLKLAPFFACSYRCEAARTFVQKSMKSMEAAYPGTRASVRSSLAQTVLYFDDGHQIVLEGQPQSGSSVRFGQVRRIGDDPDWAKLAAALAQGNEAVFNDEALRVRKDGTPWFELDRVDPGLGWMASFG